MNPKPGITEKPLATHVETVDEMPLLADEAVYDASDESKEHFLEEGDHSQEVKESTSVASPTISRAVPNARPATSQSKDPVTQQVEEILEKGLGELYLSLPDNAKPIFKAKGEEVARELTLMVRQLKIQVNRALKLVRDWLLLVPGVNKFFLEQEAKIKVDKLQEIVEARKNEPIP